MKTKNFKHNRHKLRLNTFCLFLVFNLSFSLVAQVISIEKQMVLKESKKALTDASYEMANDNFSKAEAAYRKAISINPNFISFRNFISKQCLTILVQVYRTKFIA